MNFWVETSNNMIFIDHVVYIDARGSTRQVLHNQIVEVLLSVSFLLPPPQKLYLDRDEIIERCS